MTYRNRCRGRQYQRERCARRWAEGVVSRWRDGLERMTDRDLAEAKAQITGTFSNRPTEPTPPLEVLIAEIKQNVEAMRRTMAEMPAFIDPTPRVLPLGVLLAPAETFEGYRRRMCPRPVEVVPIVTPPDRAEVLE